MSEKPAKNPLRSPAPPKPKLVIRINGATSILIGILFLASGIASLVLSIYNGSNVLALIGLGSAFWGALFLLITPKQRVDGKLLYDTVLASYLTADRIIGDFKYKGKGYHIPPYPKDVYLPEHLKGLKDVLVFVSAQDTFNFRISLEDIAEAKFLLENPQGVLITPPGLGFLEKIENKLQIEYGKTDLNELAEILPRVILENLDLAEDITMTTEGDEAKLRITNSLYKGLYSAETKLKSVSLLGCPIASTVACVLAKATGKPIAIQTYKTSPDGLTVQIDYKIEQGLNK